MRRPRDVDGLAGLSMRKVGERWGRSAMALYTYVPGKVELLDLMLDTAYGELPTSYDLTPGWRAAVEASARDAWAFYERHPWVLQVAGARALLAPHELDNDETALGLVDGLGLDGVEMTRVVSAVAGYVRGAAKAVSDARAAEQATGLDDDAWWAARAPLLDELCPDFAERFPIATRLQAEHVFDQSDGAADATPYTVRKPHRGDLLPGPPPHRGGAAGRRPRGPRRCRPGAGRCLRGAGCRDQRGLRGRDRHHRVGRRQVGQLVDAMCSSSPPPPRAPSTRPWTS